jgi:hypothetical protein
MLEFFRVNHRHEQVSEQQQRDQANDNGFHLNLLEFLAEADVESAYDKKQNHDSTEDQIVHRIVADGKTCAHLTMSEAGRRR